MRWNGPIDQNYNDVIKLHIIKKAISRADSNEIANIIMMESWKELGHQVGGKSEGKPPILMSSKNFILKPLTCKQRGFREIEFYEALKEAHAYKSNVYIENDLNDGFNMKQFHDMNLLKELVNFTVDYHGITSIPRNVPLDPSNFKLFPANSHLILSDVSNIFHRPNIVDLKIGRTTYEPDANPEKIRSQTFKYPEQEKFGFRIVGMRTYDPFDQLADAQGYKVLDKYICRRLKDESSISKIFHSFFKITDVHPSKKDDLMNLIAGVITKLTSLNEWFHRNKVYAFYASSILIVIEGDSERIRSDSFDLKMIDFAHVRYQSAHDHNYMYGLSTLLSFLENIFHTFLK